MASDRKKPGSLPGDENVTLVSPMLHLGDGRSVKVSAEEPGRYSVRGLHGMGGQARVLLVVDEVLGREIALKELLVPGEGEDGGTAQTPSGHGTTPVTRFVREARVTGQLEHPNIVPVYELGRRENGALYYTMRLVRGRTLAKALSECRGLNERLQLLPHFVDLCNAMAYAHSRGVIHRDLKPSNVMVGEFGETVLLDWGVAKVRGMEGESSKFEQQARWLREAEAGITLSGVALGTPNYMSPEQAQGLVEEVDERSDVWGLGAVLYQFLCGQAPVEGNDAVACIQKASRGLVPPLREVCPAAPAELAAVAERALRLNPGQRYQSARELAAEVRAYLTGGRVRAYAYSSWDLFRRFAARNRLALAITGLLLLVIMVSLVVVALAYQHEHQAREGEHREQLRAHYHLAQAFVQQSARMAEEKEFLSARIYAAASQLNNPAYPGGQFTDPTWAKQVPESGRLVVDARSLVYKTDHRLVAGLRRILEMKEPVLKARFSPNDRLLAGVDTAGWLDIWEAATGVQVAHVRADRGRAYGVAFSPDGRSLATGGVDRQVKIWRVGEPLPERVLEAGAEVYDVAFSPDGLRIAAGDSEGRVQVWELATGTSVFKLGLHTGRVHGLAFSPDGSLLASGSWDKSVLLSDARTGERRHLLAGHTDAVYRLSFSPDGRMLATSGYDRTVRLWDTATGHQMRILEGHKDAFFDAVFSSDGRRIATACGDGTVTLWDTETGGSLLSLNTGKEVVLSVAFSADGRTLASAGNDRAIRLWEVLAGDGLRRLSHDDWAYAIAFDQSGGLAATASWDRTVRLWDTKTGKLIRTLLGHTAGLYAVAFSPDGKTVASGGEDRSIRLWDVASGRLQRVLLGHQNAVWGLAFSHDGRLLASGSYDRTARIWEPASGRELGVLAEHEGEVYGVAFSPDGRLVATTCEDRLVRLWDVATHTVVRRLAGHGDWVSGVAFSPDGLMLASSGKDDQAILWDLQTGREIHRFQGHTQWINRVSFSPDGRFLATASDDGQAILWETKTGEPVLKFQAAGQVLTAAFLPDGSALAVADHNAFVLYPLALTHPEPDPATLLELAEKEAGLTLAGFELSVTPQPGPKP